MRRMAENTINRNEDVHENDTDAMLYMFLSVLFYFHTIRLSLAKGISTLQRIGKTTRSLQTTRYIPSNVMALTRTVPRHYTDDGGTWDSSGT